MTEHGSGRGSFARELTGAVLVVLVALGLTGLGLWARHEILHRGEKDIETLQRATSLTFVNIGAALVCSALVACAVALAWGYFAHTKRSATWVARIWLWALVFLLPLMIQLPLLPALLGFIASLGFIAWTRHAWGANWMEGEMMREEHEAS